MKIGNNYFKLWYWWETPHACKYEIMKNVRFLYLFSLYQLKCSPVYSFTINSWFRITHSMTLAPNFQSVPRSWSRQSTISKYPAVHAGNHHIQWAVVIDTCYKMIRFNVDSTLQQINIIAMSITQSDYQEDACKPALIATTKCLRVPKKLALHLALGAGWLSY